jgi:hypothetical protein
MKGWHFLVSAAHVLDKLHDRQRYYFPIAPRVTRQILGRVLVAGVDAGTSRQDDSVDVGVVILEGDGLPPYPDMNIEGLGFDRIARRKPNRHLAQYAFCGFPASKGKGNPVSKKFEPLLNTYLSGSVSRERYEEVGLNSRSHIVMPFDSRNVFDVAGDRVIFPAPSGMSGSPVWQLTGPTPAERKVVGVFIEYRERKKVFVATDIGFVFDFIRAEVQKRVDARSSSSGTT